MSAVDDEPAHRLEEAFRLDELLAEASRLSSKDPARALFYAESGLGLAESLGEAAKAARALYLRGVARGQRGDIEAAFADLLIALDRARASRERRLEAQCLHGLATAHFHQGEFPHALEYIYRCLAIQREEGNEKGVAHALGSLAGYHGTLGNYAEAITALSEGLQIARRHGDARAEAVIRCNLGLACVECGEAAAALTEFEESVRLADSVGERVANANTLCNWANALRVLGRMDEALAVADRAVTAAREVGSPHREATALMSLGQAHDAAGNTDAAEEALSRAWEIIRASGEERQVAAVLTLLGVSHRRAGRLTTARGFLEEAMARATALGQKQDACDLHLALSDLCEAENDCAGALRHYRAYHEADRALQKQSAHNLMVAQMARLEVERAQQQAEIHRLRSAELAEANRSKTALLDRMAEEPARLAREATEDALTGLHNRRYLTEHLEEALRQARRDGSELTVAIADLDDFKRVNDRFSHKVGDEVLKATARLFKRHVRGGDIVARFGGEEFVVALPGAGRAAASATCERVRRAIEAYPWSAIHPDLRVTISVGVADEPSAADGASLLALADKRLYEAKRNGKNRVV